MLQLKQLLELLIAFKELVLWIVQQEKKAKANDTTDKAFENKDQSGVESSVGSNSLGHSTSGLNSVRIEPIKDRKAD